MKAKLPDTIARA